MGQGGYSSLFVENRTDCVLLHRKQKPCFVSELGAANPNGVALFSGHGANRFQFRRWRGGLGKDNAIGSRGWGLNPSSSSRLNLLPSFPAPSRPTPPPSPFPSLLTYTLVSLWWNECRVKDTGIKGSLFTSDIKLYMGMCLCDVPFTRKQYTISTSLVISNSNLTYEHMV